MARASRKTDDVSAVGHSPLTRGWSQGLERGLRRVFACDAAIFLGLQLWPDLLDLRAGSVRTIAMANAVMTAALVVATLSLGFDEFVAIGLAVATAVVVIYDPGAPQLGIVAPLYMSYVGLAFRPRIAMAICTGLALVLATAVIGAGQRDPDLVLIDNATRVVTAFAVGIAVWHWRRIAAENDRRTASSLEQRRRTHQAQLLEAQARWVDHFLHDSLAHALKAVTFGGRLSEREITSAAGEAVEDLNRLAVPAAQVDLAARLKQVADESGLVVELHADNSPTLPSAVVEAITSAVRESLRNVRLHSGALRATVSVRKMSRGVRVRVDDEGNGFDPARLPSGHFGVRAGIVERMLHIGGRATIESSAHGTTVTLRWTSPDPADRSWLDHIDGRRALVSAAAPFILLAVIDSIVLFHSMNRPWLAMGLTVVCVGVSAWAAVRYRSQDPPRHIAIVLMMVGAAISFAAGFAFDIEHADPLQYWLAGVPMLLLLFAVFSLRVRETAPLALIAASAPTACLLLRGADAQTIATMIPAIGSPFVILGVAYAAALIGRSLAGYVAQLDELDADGFARETEAAIREELAMARVAGLRDGIAPFLHEVAAGVASPADPQVRRTAAVYEARVRDGLGREMSSWGDQLRPVVDDLRSRGASVTMARHASSTAHQTDVLERALRAITDLADEGVRVVVSITPRLDGSLAAVTVTPYLSSVDVSWNALCVGGIAVDSDHATHVRLSCVAVPRALAPDGSVHVRRKEQFEGTSA